MRRAVIFCALCCSLSTGLKAEAQTVLPDFTHVEWGRTHRGDGFVYGPTFRGSGLTVVDLDVDGDNDFVVPGDSSTDDTPQVFRNLGASGAFYPGALEDLTITGMASDESVGLSMDFEDVNADGLPDMVSDINLPNGDSGIGWFRNMGPVSSPSFAYQGTLYSTPRFLWVDWADIDNDGLNELFFIEAFLEEPTRHHRVYMIPNSGTDTSPSWNAASAVEVLALSSLLPDGLVYSAKADMRATTAGQLRPPRPYVGGAKAADSYRVCDFEVADWDADGLLDFMYYDRQEGIHWIQNLGDATTPVWDTVVASAGEPLFDHREQGMDIEEGTFALRPNPDPIAADEEWLDEFYISVNGWLMTWRYFWGQAKDFVHNSNYRLIQQNTVAYAAGQGSFAFWDYDGDGDQDLFRAGVSSGTEAYLLLFPNIGAPYAPAWGEFSALLEDSSDVLIHQGTLDNLYRQDAFVFADHDGVDGADLFVQGQDGTVSLYWAFQANDVQPLPVLQLHDPNYGDMVLSGQTGVEPRGIAIANFDTHVQADDTDLQMEIITAHASDQGGKIMYYDPYYNWTDDISSAFPGLNPNDVESIATADLDLDGRPDLIVSVSGGGLYQLCTYHVFRNVTSANTHSWGDFEFEDIGTLDSPADTAPFFGRLVGTTDIDADGDTDLFVGHQWLIGSSKWDYMRFYRNDDDLGLGFWRTRVVAGQTWDLQVGGVLPDYQYVWNASGGSLSNPGSYTAGSTAGVVDVLASSNDYRVYVDVLPPVSADESKAILLLGSAADDPLYDTFADLTGLAYWVLVNEGLAQESIRVFAPTALDLDDDGGSDVYNAPNLADIQQSVTVWTAGTQRLLVYMIDHGKRDAFRLNDNEYLSASTYASWLNTLQTGGQPQVTTVIDTCEAGTFVNDLALTKHLAKANAQRITITSSGGGPIQGVALFDAEQDISFSQSFWMDIFNGFSYGEAFDRAKVAIESINPLQAPKIDDDGDGTPNEPNDGLLAQSARPGADFEVTLPGVFIGSVAPNQVITSNQAALWVSDVVTGFPVEAAGALVVPPNLSRGPSDSDDEQPLSGMEWVALGYDALNGRWEGNYNGFTAGGLYRVQYYVQAGGRLHASPRIGFVDRVDTPDAWESDDTFASASWMSINAVQGHNFHDAGDEDWVRFAAPAGLEATIAVLEPRYRCQPRVELYRALNLEADSNATPLISRESATPGEQLVFKHLFTEAEPHLLHITNLLNNGDGQDTSYMVIVAVGTGGIVPTTLVVTTTNALTGTRVADVNVTFDNAIQSNTTTEGIAHFVCPTYANYAIAAQKNGYVAFNGSVDVNNILEALEITLTPLGGEGEGEGETSYDINGDTNINAVDVQLVINEALGIDTGMDADVNNDASVNAVDVQLVINAVLGV